MPLFDLTGPWRAGRTLVTTIALVGVYAPAIARAAPPSGSTSAAQTPPPTAAQSAPPGVAGASSAAPAPPNAAPTTTSEADTAALLALDIPATDLAALPSETRSALSQALALDAAGKFADAIAAVERRRAALPATTSPAEQRALAIVLADAHYQWGVHVAPTDGDAAVAQFQAAFALDSIYRRKQAGHDVRKMGDAYLDWDPAKALQCDDQAMAIARTITDKDGEAEALFSIGKARDYLGQYGQAIGFFEQALAIFRNVKDRDGEANVLNGLGNAHDLPGQYDQAIGFYEAALPVFREVIDKGGEADALVNLGKLHLDASQYGQAIGFFEQALPILRGIKDEEVEADALLNMGSAQYHLNQYYQAIHNFQQALSTFSAIGNRMGEATAISDLGIAYNELSRNDRSIEYHQQGLLIFRVVDDRYREAHALVDLGSAQRHLNQYSQAIVSIEQALSIFRAVEDRIGAAETLLDLGAIYDDLRQYGKASTYFELAVVICQEDKYWDGEAAALNNLGIARDHLNQHGAAVHAYEKAIIYYNRALLVHRDVEDRSGQAITLYSIGLEYVHLNRYDNAIESLEEALRLFQNVEDREGEAAALNSLMSVWDNPTYSDHNARLAILWGKQAVNVYQTIRRDLKGLDAGTQKVYLASKENTYRTLADLLVSQGRLPEAEQVLGLLKQQETFDFVRRDAQYADVLDGVAGLNPQEQAAYADYEKNADQFAAIEKQKEDLDREIGRATPTPEQKAQLDALEQHLQAASAVFQRFLNDVSARFARTAGTVGADPVEAVKAAGALTSSLLDLRAQTHGELRPVAIYTLVGPDALSIIVVDPDAHGPVAKRVPIKDGDVDRLVEQFKMALIDPHSDPKPASAKLYDLLIKPIEPELATAKPTLILWSLDGALRYIPMAALWDGKQYLVERYASAIFALKAAEKLNHLPRTDGTGLALATTQGGPGFAPLAGADEEAHLFGKPDGIVPGDRLEDAAFSKDAFFRYLEKDSSTQEVPYSVVHVASHFDLQPAGDANSSFLLLGDGEHLSVADMQTQSSTLFYGVDLLVLSACNTATAGIASGGGGTGAGKDADAGGEFEGFSNVLVGMGTESVLASLWEVSDVGTPPLMRAFYTARAGSTEATTAAAPSVSKAIALQRAQLACLSGAARPGAAGVGSDRSAALKVRAPGGYAVDSARPLAHPYYWAAFVLIGNPR
jgi:CHAT domain-containing protein